MERINCQQLFGKSNFESYSEFYFSLCIAAECKRRGMQLDMSSMKIDKDLLPFAELDYFRYLLNTEALYIDGVQADSSKCEPNSLVFNTDLVSKYYGKLFKETPEKYIWTVGWLMSTCADCPEMQNISKMGNMLMHLVAHFVVEVSTGSIEKKPLEIIIDEQKVKSTYIYVNLVSCSKTLELFDSLVELNIDFSDFNLDLDYSILCNNGIASKRNRLWSIHEKRQFFDSEGFKPGMVGILWERKGMCESNPAGRITGAKLVRIDEATPECVFVTIISVNKTKEEVLDDYLDIPEEKRALFADMLDAKPRQQCMSLEMYDLGINNYFLNEHRFLTKIDTKSIASKKVTIEGKATEITMSEVDAIYWLLCQYEIDFDRELYKDMYNNREDLLWDKYGSYED